MKKSLPQRIKFPILETSKKIIFEVLPETEVFLKYIEATGINKKPAQFGVYYNNERYPIKSNAYLEINKNPEGLDLYDVYRSFFRF